MEIPLEKKALNTKNLHVPLQKPWRICNRQVFVGRGYAVLLNWAFEVQTLILEYKFSRLISIHFVKELVERIW